MRLLIHNRMVDLEVHFSSGRSLIRNALYILLRGIFSKVWMNLFSKGSARMVNSLDSLLEIRSFTAVHSR